MNDIYKSKFTGEQIDNILTECENLPNLIGDISTILDEINGEVI